MRRNATQRNPTLPQASVQLQLVTETRPANNYNSFLSPPIQTRSPGGQNKHNHTTHRNVVYNLSLSSMREQRVSWIGCLNCARPSTGCARRPPEMGCSRAHLCGGGGGGDYKKWRRQLVSSGGRLPLFVGAPFCGPQIQFNERARARSLARRLAATLCACAPVRGLSRRLRGRRRPTSMMMMMMMALIMNPLRGAPLVYGRAHGALSDDPIKPAARAQDKLDAR